MKHVLLDTNAYVAFTKGDQRVQHVIAKAKRVFLSLISEGELLFGFKNGSIEQKNRDVFESFLSKPNVRVVYPTRETAELYSDIYIDLRKKGKPIPTNDIWIAACCIETGSVMVTYDKHFLHVTKLRIWSNLRE